MLDDVIDRHTAVCDLPRHSQCGLSIDHHQSNAPADDEDNSEMVVVWKSYAICRKNRFELVGEVVDLSDLSGVMEWVDKLDGGSVSKEEFLSDHPVVWLGRIIGGNELISLEI